MPRKTPLERAFIEGRHLRHPERYRSQTLAEGRPLGDPYPRMTRDQRDVWEELRRELPWLKASHRVIVRLTCVAMARLTKVEDASGRRAALVASLLQKLGATPTSRR